MSRVIGKPKDYEDLEHDYIDYIPMEVDNICDQKYNATEFKKGIKDASYHAGFYTSLINIGIDKEEVIEILKLNLKNPVIDTKIKKVE